MVKNSGLLKFSLLIIILTLAFVGYDQPPEFPGGGGGPGPPCWPPPCIPIDNSVYLLIFAGVGLGVMEIYRRKVKV